MNITREHVTAWLATLAAVLTATVALYVDAGLGNLIGAALIAYTLTVLGVARRFQLRLGRVLRASGRGAVITAVVIVLLLVSIGRSAAHLVGAA